MSFVVSFLTMMAIKVVGMLIHHDHFNPMGFWVANTAENLTENLARI